MDPNSPSPDDSRSNKLDLKALDTALEKRTIELPAGVTPGGSINTIAVVPLGPSPTSQSIIVESPEQEVPHYFSLDAAASALRSGSRPTPGSSLEVPDAHAGPFYGAKSAALKQFDESRAATRTHSVASTPPRSVAGIGSKIGKPDYSEAKIVLALVGLPARGKSYLSNKLMRYLTWLEYKVKVFNVGQLRRKKALEREKMQGVKEDHNANYFDHNNANAMKARESFAEESLESLISWLKAGGNVGIHGQPLISDSAPSTKELTRRLMIDATNSNRARRAKIAARVSREPNLKLVFLESLCEDPVVIAANVALKASAGDPDYKGMSHEEAVEDFTKRIRQYEAVYETVEPFEWEGMPEEKDGNITPAALEEKRLTLIDEAAKNPGPNNPKLPLVTKQMAKNVSYLKVINVGKQLDIIRISGYLQSRIAYYLMNLHLKPRSIFMSRHGESQYNVDGRIGGDAPLSPRGEAYAQALPSLILDNIGDKPLKVWTSTLQRTIQTARHLPYPKLTWKSLDELDAGVCDGMTYEEIEEHYPEDFANRDEDKFNYRYRGGESYRDVVVRLEPVIMELERQENVLVIGHQAIVRCLYAYFHNISQEDLPYINIPLHTVIKLTPKAYGCDEERYKVPIQAVSTHRPKPKAETGAQGDPAAVEKKRATSARNYYGDDQPA
ncbi:Fructose-2,6-bisphosphatase [Tulasnella sp. UAMH 9824]|nr:Fructose-2,6-bisphosphatase [Tulasnella sp. UAMH 9824]